MRRTNCVRRSLASGWRWSFSKDNADPKRKRDLELDIAELDLLIDEILLASLLEARQGARRSTKQVDLLALLRSEECARYDEIELDGRPVTVRGDPRLLRRMIRNLLENARRHGAPPIAVSVGRVGKEPSCASVTVGRESRRRSARASSVHSTDSQALEIAAASGWAWPWCARSRVDTAAMLDISAARPAAASSSSSEPSAQSRTHETASPMRSPLRPVPAAVERWIVAARALRWLDTLTAWLALWVVAAMAFPERVALAADGRGRPRRSGSGRSSVRFGRAGVRRAEPSRSP